MSEIRCNAAQSFQSWFTANFDEEFKNKEAAAIRKGLSKLKQDIISNVHASGLNHTGELAQGVVLSVNKDTKTGKVHILGKKAKGGYLRIFELGTYKDQRYKKPRIKPRYLFTNALLANKSSIAPAIMDNLRQLIINAKKNG